MSNERSNPSKTKIEFVLHLPFAVRNEDALAVGRVLNELFFESDHLHPELEEKLKKSGVDVGKLNIAVSKVQADNRKSSTECLETLARREGIDLSRLKNIRIRVNEVVGRKLGTFVENLRSLDGRKTLFVTVRVPEEILSGSSSFGLSMLIQGFLDSNTSGHISKDFLKPLDEKGIALSGASGGPPLFSRLSSDSRTLLKKYGVKEEEWGGIRLLLDPSMHDNSFIRDFLARTGLAKNDFATHENVVQ